MKMRLEKMKRRSSKGSIQGESFNIFSRDNEEFVIILFAHKKCFVFRNVEKILRRNFVFQQILL
jgi:hypothetical protein